jgi:hypothetical protein
MTLKQGDKVKITEECARWYLDHPDVFYTHSGVQDPVYNMVMQYCIYICMGGEVTGTVVQEGSQPGVYGVDVKTPFGNDFTYFDVTKDLIKL